MNKIIILLLVAFSVTSCALNKLFLNPRPLTVDFQRNFYSPETKDTLSLAFKDVNTPVITTKTGELAKFSYEIENVNFKSSRDRMINGWLVKPKNYNGTTIYFLHGNSGNIPYNFPLAEPFAKRGYQVFLIDYSGFGFSEGKAKRKDILKDANEGLDYLLNRKDITYDKLVIYGQSLGGHLSCIVANQNQDKIDGLVVEGAFSSHKDIAADQVPVLARIFVREIYSAEKNLPKFKKPVMIIHSTEDTRIDIKHGKRLFEVANEPKIYYQIDKKHVRGPLYYADSICFKIDQILNSQK
ncbi:MAG TPA: alpha/beta fold hydrolase [Crocinitomicaceae bacterium]|nr:alpha/beta fold hydrolase [Crocinitomicaceae bacterium]